MRNFWVKANVDGRKTPLTFGPRAKDGGLSISILINDNESLRECVYIDCSVVYGDLVIKVLTANNNTVTLTIPKEK